ncbi:MAG: glycoside hydrolase family 3 protein [Lachnospiraceae bacterium]|nr:glycoside hydrolase family 3 protein [Lachnospiraceae bacterium]
MFLLRRITLAALLICLLTAFCACSGDSSASSHSLAPTLPGAASIHNTPPESKESASPLSEASSGKPETAPASPPSSSAPVETTTPEASLPSSDPAETLPESSEESSAPPTTEVDIREALRPRAEEYMAHMDLRSKLFPLMIVSPEANCWMNPVTTPEDDLLPSRPVAGLLFQAKNMENPQQLTALVEGRQASSLLPLFICVDEEGGRVSRIIPTMGTTPIKNMYTYRGDGTEKARKNARTLATDISRFGFNLNFAPVADVWSHPENQVIGERAYGDDFQKTARLVASAVKGFHDANIICTLKHFPGHGDTLEDSHNQIAMVHKSAEELRTQELLPFIAGIEAGADMVMSGHLMVPAIDPENPATFSHLIITKLLREELGFQGVIITDALEMGGAQTVSSGGEACLKALLAGHDLLLCPEEQPEKLSDCVDNLLEAVESGLLSEERIDESLLRVLTLKLQYGLLK